MRLERCRGPVQVVGHQAQDIGQDMRIVHHKRQLVSWRKARETRIQRKPSLLLCSDQRLDLVDECLGRDGLLVGALKVDALVVQCLVKVARIDFAPHLVPLALRTFPFLVLLLQPRQHDRHSDARVVVERSDHLESVLPSVHLLDDALVYALALPAEPRLESERCSLVCIHHGDPRGNGLQQGYRAQIRLDVVVVLVALLFTAIQRIFVHVFLVRIERLALTRPCGMANPAVVQHLPAQCVASTARQLDFASRQLPVRRPARLLRRQVEALALQCRHILQHRVFVLEPSVPTHVVADKRFECAQQLRPSVQKQRYTVHERRHIDHVLCIQIQQLQKVHVGRAVIEVLLDSLKESHLIHRRYGRRRHRHKIPSSCHVRRRIRLRAVHAGSWQIAFWRQCFIPRRQRRSSRIHGIAHHLAWAWARYRL